VKDVLISLPWFSRHRPFMGLHFCNWGDQCYRGRHRPIYHVGIGFGLFFTDHHKHWFWDLKGFWRRSPGEGNKDKP